LPASSPFNPLGIISAPTLATAPAAYHPAKPLAAQLWKLYLDNVDAQSQLKLLHRPTDEIKVFTTIDNPAAAPMDHLALNYVVYYSAVVTIVGLETDILRGHDKRALLHQFKLGLEQAFAYASFLDHPTITGLQALAMYLVCPHFTHPLAKFPLNVQFRRLFVSTTAARAFGSSTALPSAQLNLWVSTATASVWAYHPSNQKSVVDSGGSSCAVTAVQVRTTASRTTTASSSIRTSLYLLISMMSSSIRR
jgi:hypothetical protein